MLSAGKKPSGDEAGQVKDTRKNIEQQKHFVVHIAATEQIEPLNQSAATLNHGISEVKQAELTTTPFEGFSLPRLESCSIALGCTLYRLDEIGNTPQAVIYGQIEHMYIDDDIVIPHDTRLVIDAKKLNPLARLGGNDYAGLGELLQAARPK